MPGITARPKGGPGWGSKREAMPFLKYPRGRASQRATRGCTPFQNRGLPWDPRGSAAEARHVVVCWLVVACCLWLPGADAPRRTPARSIQQMDLPLFV